MDIKEQIAFLREHKYLPQKQLQQTIAVLEKLYEQEQALSQTEVMAYAAKIRPLIRGSEKHVSILIKNAELFWAQNAPIHTESFSYNHKTPLQKAEGLTEIGRITTYHRYGGYCAFLRPSVDEAIYQCPKEWRDKICAFEYHAASDRLADIYNSKLDRHVLTTIYYAGKIPASVAALPIKW